MDKPIPAHNFAPRNEENTRTLTREQWKKMKERLRDNDDKLRSLEMAEREE